VIRQTVQMKNRVSGILMETGVDYSKHRLHKVGYLEDLFRPKHPAATEAEPGDDGAWAEAGLYPREFAGAGAADGGETATAENCSRRESDHREFSARVRDAV
jgi:hypothetical protein